MSSVFTGKPLSLPGKRDSKYNFPGNPGIPGIDFFFIKLKKGNFLKYN
jgi:hypothetical protein